MKQHATLDQTAPRLQRVRKPAFLKRLLPPGIFFLIAFTLDMLTDQRYSSIWGSGAIIASILSLFPAIRSAATAICAYGGVWLGFNLLRAVADSLNLNLTGPDIVAKLETSLFGAHLPSAWLQQIFFEPNRLAAWDALFAIVHGSFFVVPFLVAVICWRRAREWFRPLTIATGVAFGLGIIGFILIPTEPPWLADPANVTRITRRVVETGLGVSLSGHNSVTSDGGFAFEPNHLAAMPSVHVAVAVLVFLLATRFGRVAGIAGLTYALFMCVGVVYLGEHYVLDAAGGWIIASAGWITARRWMPSSPGKGSTRHASPERPVSDTGRCPGLDRADARS